VVEELLVLKDLEINTIRSILEFKQPSQAMATEDA
jgi:hypothetical protein